MVETLAQFGVAGLMGLLWVWERMHSRRREQQLSDAHQRLMMSDRQLEVLIRLVQQLRAFIQKLLEQIIHVQSSRRRTAYRRPRTW